MSRAVGTGETGIVTTLAWIVSGGGVMSAIALVGTASTFLVGGILAGPGLLVALELVLWA